VKVNITLPASFFSSKVTAGSNGSGSNSISETGLTF
jgi:hypothetical protein